MHGFANPKRFLSFARPLTPWLLVLGLALAGGALFWGLTRVPAERLQGETVRILFLHVPAAWLGMAGWMTIAGASLAEIVWRHPLATIAGRAAAVPGAFFTALCLVTGSLWGRPAWGTWWEWDGRLTSMLVLLFLYLGYIARGGLMRETLDPWPFVIAAYAIGVVGTLVLVGWSWLAMRRAERRRDGAGR